MTGKKEYKVACYCRLAIEPPTALYCRTATKTTLADNLGIETQKQRLLRFAEENSYSNPVLYIDNGESGETLNRPAMKRLMDDIKTGSVRTVIVTSTDRVARGISIFMDWVSFLEKSKARCLSLENGGQNIANESAFWRSMLNDHEQPMPLSRAYRPFRNLRMN